MTKKTFLATTLAVFIIIFGGWGLIRGFGWILSKVPEYECVKAEMIVSVEPISVKGTFGGDIRYIAHYNTGNIKEYRIAPRIGDMRCLREERIK